jgi:glycosyltransferase involved in cell wall biosynthesis
MRDAALVRAIRKLGHDIVMLPMYLPVSSEDEGIAKGPVFFGGINVYLQQKLGLFRKTPRWIDALLDKPGLLKLVGKKAGMVKAAELGQTTVSMLEGENGRQVKELDRLVEWLVREENRPDVVCLSNALIIGLARRIKEKLGVPIVCLLQDEDGFLDGLSEPWRSQAWEIVRDRASDVDVFISVSRYYADVCKERLGIEAERMKTIHTGIDLGKYEVTEGNHKPGAIGFLSRMCEGKGLGDLVEVFLELKKEGGLGDLRLLALGGMSGDDDRFVEGLKSKIESQGFGSDAEFSTEFDSKRRIEFFKEISVLCVPERKPIAYGLYVLEAIVSGVPFVEPGEGVFVELMEETGAGILYNRGDKDGMKEGLKRLLLDEKLARELGTNGREAAERLFDVTNTASEMTEVFEALARS